MNEWIPIAIERDFGVIDRQTVTFGVKTGIFKEYGW